MLLNPLMMMNPGHPVPCLRSPRMPIGLVHHNTLNLVQDGFSNKFVKVLTQYS